MLGERMRQRRQELGLSLRDLAAQVGLTASFLSQLERDLVSPSLGSLRRLAQALGVPIFYLLEEQPAVSPVVRRDQRRRLTLPDSQVTYQLLAPDLNRKMEVFLTELQPGQRNVALSLAQPTEECIFVLQGSLEVRLDDGAFTLEAGDSIYFEGPRLRELIARGDEPLTFISAITRAVF